MRSEDRRMFRFLSMRGGDGGQLFPSRQGRHDDLMASIFPGQISVRVEVAVKVVGVASQKVAHRGGCGTRGLLMTRRSASRIDLVGLILNYQQKMGETDGESILNKNSDKPRITFSPICLPTALGHHDERIRGWGCCPATCFRFLSSLASTPGRTSPNPI